MESKIAFVAKTDNGCEMPVVRGSETELQRCERAYAPLDLEEPAEELRLTEKVA